MKTSRRPYALLSLIPLLLFVASMATTSASLGFQGATGSVFTMTNSTSGNAVEAYSRSAGGQLTYAGSFSTGGLGLAGLTGSNQGGLTLSQDGSWLFVVNAGSNTLSVFHVDQFPSTSLTRTDVVSSDGVAPISVTVFGNWVYVLNQGSGSVASNIAGFTLTSFGTLIPIRGSIQPLSEALPSPAQISFSPTGNVLIVTEKGTNTIDGYSVNFFGQASGPVLNPSNGDAPYGFAFDSRGQLIVSDAASDALSSYSVSPSGSINVISGSISNGGQAAPCWVAVTPTLAFTTDAHVGNISSYAISPSGKLTLLQSVAASTGWSIKPDLDMAISQNNQFLYVYVAGGNEIQAYSIHSNGVLSLIQTVSGLTAGGDGLAAN